MGNYTCLDYQKDLAFIRKHDTGAPDAIGKLEILMGGPGKHKLFIRHGSLKEQYLPFSDIRDMIEDPAAIFCKIREFERLPFGEQKQVRTEVDDFIFEEINRLFDQRYRGALQRVKRYEVNNPPAIQAVENPVSAKFRELRSALREKNPDKVYELAERICIMAESFDDNHPVVVDFKALRPEISKVLK